MDAAQTKEVWGGAEWAALERRTRARAARARTETAAWRVIARQARVVMRAYTTSFFIVSRFLPAAKRAEVEMIYAAVRYPDEIVDTFPLAASERLHLLDEWEKCYEVGLGTESIAEALRCGVPPFLAGFTKVVRERGIPEEHYRSFLAAMRRDVYPRPFATLDELIEDYVYGSAVVVGYFLTHVYGARTPATFGRALMSAHDLGIALQLTNFLRDIGEDKRRGRVYLPVDMLHAEGIDELDVDDESQHAALVRAQGQLAAVAADYYARAESRVEAFAPDCRPAIQACINVYGRLNERIASGPSSIRRRESVPLREKLQALPPSKFWRIPLAYLLR